MVIGLTTILIFLVVFALSFFILQRRRGLPPGPVALPLLGCVGFLWKSARTGLPPHQALTEASRRHGSVLSIWIGPKLLVVLNGYETIHKAFVLQGADFIDRPHWISQVRHAVANGKGISWSSGVEWKKMRKFTLQHLRSFGFGTNVMEERIVEEVEKVSKILLESKGALLDIAHTLQYAVSNVICSIVFGQKFEYNDPTFLALLRIIDLAVKGQGFTSVANFIPEFMYPLFPKENALIQEKRRNAKTMRDFFDRLIQAHEETFDRANIRDFLDYYIMVKGDGGVEESLKDESYFNESNIYRVIHDLFIAGSETTASVLHWCILYLIEYPDVQTKCRQHIKNVVGERQVRLSDRGSLPFIDAMIQEVLRLSNVVPLGVPRTNADRDVFIDGYRIPKRTLILANLYSAHTDPKYWANPLVFDPSRFLDHEGNLLKTDSFIPLSLGARNCPGESLARMEMFLFISSLIQRFDLSRDENAPPKDFSADPEQFITLVPKGYRLKATPLA